MRVLLSGFLVFLIVGLVALLAWGFYAQTEAINRCHELGYATGDALIDGNVICYRGEIIGRRR